MILHFLTSVTLKNGFDYISTQTETFVLKNKFRKRTDKGVSLPIVQQSLWILGKEVRPYASFVWSSDAFSIYLAMKNVYEINRIRTAECRVPKKPPLIGVYVMLFQVIMCTLRFLIVPASSRMPTWSVHFSDKLEKHASSSSGITCWVQTSVTSKFTTAEIHATNGC